MPASSRDFIIGETIHLTSRVSATGTKIPVDPEVVALVSMRTGEEEVLTGYRLFTRVGIGEYSLSVITGGMAAGVYELVIRHSTGTDQVALFRETFVLREATVLDLPIAPPPALYPSDGTYPMGT